MKNGLLVCFGDSSGKNIGDYIQSVAQEQFWTHIDQYCERESLPSIVSKETINLIMNGWFMWHPHNFPPANCINPFFISFHLNPAIADVFFTKQTIDYLKKYEPIGARDMGTKRLLESKGIKSYFSSCLTLTLGNKYKSSEKTDEIIFVDPYFKMSGNRENLFDFRLYISSVLNLVRYRRKINKIKEFETEHRTIWGLLSKKLEKKLAAANFYASYKNAFDDDVLLKSIVLTHKVNKKNYPNNEALMQYARELIHRYASAKLVISSRIHCALPCLAVETPVIYVQSGSLEDMRLRSPGRMEGLIELFNILHFKNGCVQSENNKKIGRYTQLHNKPDYKKYAIALTDKVSEFVDKTKSN